MATASQRHPTARSGGSSWAAAAGAAAQPNSAAFTNELLASEIMPHFA
jgi:hypothetical protein